MNSIKQNGGFTLFDVMIALAIGAIVTTVGIPSYRNVVSNQRMTNATNEFVMALNLAKSEAIKRVKYVTVCKSTDGATCGGDGSTWNDGWIVFENATGANLGVADAGDEIIRAFPSLHENLTLEPSGTIGGFLSIRPSGTIGSAVANMTGTLTLCDEWGDQDIRGVIIESSGQWRVSHEKSHDDSALSCH
jgi:type IV fimbrial biogenesis protein FimT